MCWKYWGAFNQIFFKYAKAVFEAAFKIFKTEFANNNHFESLEDLNLCCQNILIGSIILESIQH
jgi:hypothetical protein